MEQEIRVTPEELYYLGGLMDAKYIDYEYVAAMGDIQINSSMYQSKVKTALAKKGLLEEDFSGNMELSQVVKESMAPIFFGEFESSIDICIPREEEQAENIKYHFYEDKIVRVVREEYDWDIKIESPEKIEREIKKWVSETDEKEQDVSFDSENVSQIVVIKHVQIGEESIVKVYFLCGGVLFSENEKDEVTPVNWKTVVEEAVRILLPAKEGG